MTDDARHLQLLSIFHYVLAGLLALGGCFPIVYIVFGILMLTGVADAEEDPATMRGIGLLFTVIGSGMIAICWIMAAFVLVAGRRLSAQRHYTYCLIIAGFECILVPIGTVLGVFTIVVLTRPSVKTLFHAEEHFANEAAG